MATPLVPLINGNRFSFADIEFRIPQIGARRYIGCKAINYKETLEPGKVYGTASQKIGRTKGKHDANGSVELYLQEADDLIFSLVSTALARGYPPGTGFMEIIFDILVAYATLNSPIISKVIRGARIIGSDESRSEGTDPLSVKLDLDIMIIDHVTAQGTVVQAVSPISLLNT